MLLAIGLIAAVMLLAWAGVEINDLFHAHQGQFWFAVIAFMVLSFALAAAKFRKANERVPLRPAPPALPPVVVAKPEALEAAPVLRAIAWPEDTGAADCEGPACSNKVDDDPWTARVEGDEADHVFCSQSCAQQWRDRRPASSLL